MKYQGREFNIARHLGWRMADPERDFDYDLNPIESNYIIIVSLKDCEILEDNKYDPKNAPALFPHRYSPMNRCIYGIRRQSKCFNGYKIRRINLPVYLVNNDKVYQSSIYYPANKIEIEKYQEDKIARRKWRRYLNGEAMKE